MAARFIEPLDRQQAERIAGFVDETLRAIGVELDVPLHVLPRHAVKGQQETTLAWVNRHGVHLFLDTLDLDDDRLQTVTIEEVAHFWLCRAHPRVAASGQLGELFANWTVYHVTGGRMVIPRHMGPDSQNAGRYAACALAGFVEGRDALEAAGAGAMLRMVGRLEKALDDDPNPQLLAGLLVAELDGR